MPTPKYIRIRRDQDFFPTVLGLHFLKLIKAGYTKFEVVEVTDEHIILKAIRRKGGRNGEQGG